MANITFIRESPPLPSFVIKPVPSLIRGIPDLYLTLILPIIAYWGWGFMFFAFDTLDFFDRYRLHTPAEIRKRNIVPISNVIRCVLIQQSWQIVLGLWFYSGPGLTGQEDYEVAVWATRARSAQRHVPLLLGSVGIDSQTFARRIFRFLPAFAGFLNGGGLFFDLHDDLNTLRHLAPAYVAWEVALAKLFYHFLVPALQFGIAIFVADSWQFWLHWASHRNSWVFNNLHSVHHRVYCPYAFGAFYANLAEAFVWDVGGTGLALWLSRLTVRQAMWFTTLSVCKSVDDHCGYALPLDPFQWINGQNAAYHDIHHQSWGMKTNFAQVYTTWWDKLLGTQWVGHDLVERYERGRCSAERAARREEEESSS